jgi:GDP-4-dehydro-6-deoxy-D-mannose reductase
MRILLTGVTGFAGSWLAEALLARGGCSLVGLSRHGSWPTYCEHLAPQIPLHSCDLCSATEVESLLRAYEPEQIYHLAGYANVGKSFKEPAAAWHDNLTATLTLYDAVLRWGGGPRILTVSSGLIYGEPRSLDDVFHEERTLHPSSPYAASKAAADLASYQYFASEKLSIIRARPFNHIGPRQSPDFAVSHFARQLVEIERGTRPPLLETGDLSSERDLTDVRDVASAYVKLMDSGEPGETYNIACGTNRSMQSVLDDLVRLVGVEVQVRLRADLLRPSEPTRMRVAVDKLKARTGWTPGIALERSLRDILDDWRSRS